MPVRLRLIPLLAAAAVLLPTAGAHAATPRVLAFPGEVVDGPSADLVSVGGADVSRDGTGAVAYVKRDGGVPHVFVSRLVDGAFAPPERIDGSIADPADDPAVTVGENGKVIVAWSAGATVYAALRPSAQAGWGGPQPLGAATGPARPSVDLGTNDVAYVVWSAGGDVRAARLDRGATAFAALPAPLDADPAATAGADDDRAPHVAVAADGVALVVWGERGADGIGHVVARKLFGLVASTTFEVLDVASFQNTPADPVGADQPAVDIENDSSYAWVVFRQAFTDNGQTVTRALARRQRGTAFDDPVAVDGLGFPGAAEGVDAPAIDLSGTGDGIAAAGRSGSGQVYGAALKFDEFLTPFSLGTGTSVSPVAPIVEQSDDGDGLVAWVIGSAAPTIDGSLHVRPFDDEVAQPEVIPEQPALGPVDQFAGLAGGVDRTDDGAVLAIQGTGPDRRLVATMFDKAPAYFVGNSGENFRRSALPDLRWALSRDLWGGCTYTVTVDNTIVGTTRALDLQLKTPVPDGTHRWRVACTDRRGQTTAAATRLLRIDATPPTVSFAVTGTLRTGKPVRIAATVADSGGSGLKLVRILAGDGTPVVAARALTHVYTVPGTYTIRVSATDGAGNAVATTQLVTIKKPPKPKKPKKPKGSKTT